MASSNSKAVKSALKEAREKINSGDHRAALKCVNRALNVDADNYLGLVFAGVCHVETGQLRQARESYRRAISVDSEQPVAWQGLASLYEKHTQFTEEGFDPSLELTEAYEKLVQLMLSANDSKKYLDTAEKLWRKRLERDEISEAVEAMISRISFLDDRNEGSKAKEARADLIRVLSQRSGLSQELNELLLKTLNECIVPGEDSVQNLEHQKFRLRLLYSQMRMQALLEAALAMFRSNPDSTQSLEWICKVYVQWAADELSFDSRELSEEADRFSEKLLSLNPKSALGLLAKGSWLYRQKKFGEAADCLRNHCNKNFYGALILSRSLHQTDQDPAAAAAAASTAAQLLEIKVKDAAAKKRLKLELDTIRAQSLYRLGKMEEAAEAVEGAISSTEKALPTEMRLLRVKINVARRQDLGNVEEEIDRMTGSAPAHELNFIRAVIAYSRNHDLNQASTYLESALTDQPSHYDSLMLQGRIFEAEKLSDKALTSYLRAAKAAPGCPGAFLRLGMAYRRRGDADKARRCLQKAYSLDGGSEEAGAMLSDVYREQGATESNLEFLKSVTMGPTASSGESRWAYIRLGVLYLEQDDSTNAILSFQSALRRDSTDCHAWECLADAYMARGSYTAALKAFDKVLRLSPSSLHASLQIGNIKLLLGHFSEAREAFKELVLTEEPPYVPALKGLGESLLALARDYLSEFVDEAAVDCCEEAIWALACGIWIMGKARKEEATCMWKLLGEACTLVWHLPKETLREVQVPELLTASNEDKAVVSAAADHLCDPRKWKVSDSSTKLDKLGLLELGAKCYFRALHMKPSLATAWHDLAINFHAQATTTNLSGGDDDEKTAAKLDAKSMAMARRAVALRPSAHPHWNLLGVLALRLGDFPLAQHCLVRSTALPGGAVDAPAWTNLGILYMILGDVELANKSFKEAQNSDPSWLRAWVGQALLAEGAGYDEETMDLFRHTTFLGNELESGLGYANWVCRTLEGLHPEVEGVRPPKPHNRYCVEKMFGITVATDCLQRYNKRVKMDSCSLTMLGALLERQGLLRPAQQALELALHVLQTSSDPDEEKLRKVLQSLGRVCLRLGQPDAAIAHIANACEPDFYACSCLALAYYRSRKYREAYEAYNAALLLAQPSLKAHVLAAMATVAYRVQGAQAAKTLLFQSSQMSPPSIPGLFALCVLGIKEGDMTLIEAALEEMNRFRDDPTHLSEIASLKALVLCAKGRIDLATRQVVTQVHKWPQHRGLWEALAKHLILANQEEDSAPARRCRMLAAASRCAEKSAGLGRLVTNELEQRSCASASDSNLITLALLLASSSEMSSGPLVTKLRRASAKAVHLHPDNPSAWCLLLAARLRENRRADSKITQLFLRRAQVSLKNSGRDGKLAGWMGSLRGKGLSAQ